MDVYKAAYYLGIPVLAWGVFRGLQIKALHSKSKVELGKYNHPIYRYLARPETQLTLTFMLLCLVLNSIFDRYNGRGSGSAVLYTFLVIALGVGIFVYIMEKYGKKQ